MGIDFKGFIDSKAQRKTVNDLMTTYDENGNGSFSKSELQNAIDSSLNFGGGIALSAIGGSGSVVNQVFNNLDTSGDGEIDENELDTYLQRNFGLSLDDVRGYTLGEMCDILTGNTSTNAQSRPDILDDNNTNAAGNNTNKGGIAGFFIGTFNTVTQFGVSVAKNTASFGAAVGKSVADGAKNLFSAGLNFISGLFK